MSHVFGYLTEPKRSWPSNRAQLLLIIVALVLGVAVTQLPILTSLILLLVSILTVATLIDPLVGIVVVLITGPFKPLTDYFLPQLPLDVGQIALIITLGSWVIYKIRHREVRIPSSPLTVALLLFLGAASLSIPGSLSLSFAAKELLKWIQMLVMMWMVIDLAGAEGWKRVVAGLLAAGVIQALIGVWQFGIRGTGPEHFLILGDQFYRAYGSFEQPNPFGGFIGLLLPLSIGLMLGAFGSWIATIQENWSTQMNHSRGFLLNLVANRHAALLYGFGMISGLLGAALIMSWSRGAWVGFGVAAAVMVFAWPRKASVGLVLVIVALLGGVLALKAGILPASIAGRLTGFSGSLQTFDVRGVDITSDNYAVLERLAHWQTAEAMAQVHFWFGVGIGNYEPLYPAYALLNWPQALGHAHNIYLNLLAETGIIGLSAYIALWVVVIGLTWKVTRSSNVWNRSLGVGLLGTWTHLSVHNFLDKLYVANLHLHIGALLGVLTFLLVIGRRQTDSLD